MPTQNLSALRKTHAKLLKKLANMKDEITNTTTTGQVEKNIELRHRIILIGREIRCCETEIIKHLPVGSDVHYRGYPMSEWVWLGERTGQLVKHGRKYAIIRYDDDDVPQKEVRILYNKLREGKGENDNEIREMIANVGQALALTKQPKPEV